MDSVILTGATGFIGRHCITQLLDAGYKVHALYQKERGADELPQKENLSWHRLDILDQVQVAKELPKLAATHMLHLAWYAEPGKYWDSRMNLDWLRASIHLLKIFTESGGKRFVGAGSAAEYDWSYDKLNEAKTPLNPATLYGTCKSSLFQTAQQNATTSGVEFAWGRVFWLYGPGEDKRRLVAYVINSLLNEEEANCTNGTQERDYMYVNDVARAFVLLLQSKVQGAVNIGCGETVSVATLADTIAKLIDKESLVQLGAVLNRTEPASLVADVTRLRDELKFKPEFELEVGMLHTLEWWRKQQTRTSTQLAI